MLARLGNDSLLTVRNELGAVASHLATSKVQIDILLDKAQLHHSGSLRTEPSAAGEALDDIKDKVDKIAARIFSRPNSSTDGNIADDLWQMFYDDLLNEGFSKPVLDRNKDVLRAYVRELDSQEFSDGSKTPSEPRFLHTKALSSEASASAKLASKTFGLISTDELVAQDAAEREKRSPYILHLASPSGRYLPNRGMPTSTGITTSARWALPPPYSEGQERRLAPDSQGREIPPSAKWTKIKRSLVSPEVLQRAGVRYEARPEFVAVLGILSKEQILEYSRQSAEIRQRRRHQNARPASKTAPKRIAATSASSHAGSTTEEDPDPWDLDLQAWDSDLDAWNLKRNGSEDSDSGDVSWDDSESDAAEPQRDSAVRSSKVRFSTSPRYIPPQSPEKPGPEVRVGPKPILKFGDLGPSMAGAAVAGLASSSSTGATSDKEREGDTRPSLNLFGSKWRERDRDRDRDRYRDHDRDRDRRRDRDRERDRDRDKDRDERVAQKKQTLKESLGAAGIGGAAATLLSVLADAAVHL
ncbi:hypothetical protein B0T14DRAFT_494255 [Immersiella caudata]|uniref:DUF8035 domain-containing protein n=1 Tax=Immersiella caudata TaxID=314043 RepID=A0AA39WW16_9PEZI|nr:hypothetical protein B0T14DRAFT_494255 [Immersiella caudata]